MPENRGVVYIEQGRVEVQGIPFPKLETPDGRKIGHGVILRGIGDTLAFCPPMIIKEAELNELFDRAEKALDDTEGWVGKEELRAA